MSCSENPEKTLTFHMGALLKPESGGILPKYFTRGFKVCVDEVYTRTEDCGCPQKAPAERMREVRYYRFTFDGKTYSVKGNEIASTGAPLNVGTEEGFREMRAGIGDGGYNATNRNDKEIAERWGKLPM